MDSVDSMTKAVRFKRWFPDYEFEIKNEKEITQLMDLAKEKASLKDIIQ